MATAQQFDTLDGLVVTGQLDTGTLTATGNVVVDTNVLYVDTVNNRIGINKVPAVAFDVSGDVNIDGGTIDGLSQLSVDNITLNNQTIECSSLLVLKSGSSNAIDLDSGAGAVRLEKGSTEYGRFTENSGSLVIAAGSSTTTALTLQADGDAFFAANVHMLNGDYFHLGANTLRGTNSGVQISANTYHAGHLVHSTSDTDTHIKFNNDQIVLTAGGNAVLTANSSTVDIGIISATQVVSETVVYETVQTTGSLSMDLNSGSAIICTATGGGTVSFTMPSGTTPSAFSWTVKFNNSGTLTWPAAVKWAEGQVPPPSSGTDVYAFTTYDKGVNIYGSLAMRDAS